LKVCFVTRSNLSRSVENAPLFLSGAQLILASPLSMGLVSYEDELCGNTEHFLDIAKLSKELKSVIIAGCDTDTYGSYRRSAVIADNGKLLGVSDAIFLPSDSEYTKGVTFTVYKTSVGKIGVLVGNDFYSFETVRAMSFDDADVIAVIGGDADSPMPDVVVRAEAFLFGVPMLKCSFGYATAINSVGEVSFSSPLDVSVVDFNAVKTYDNILYEKGSDLGR
jgi:predicted amidohydrolase